MRNIINKNSKIKKKILKFLLFFFIFLTAFFSILFYGIQVDNFNSKLFRIEGLYIKLDKKLIVKVKNIEIHKQKEEKPTNKQLIYASHICKIIQIFFQEIDLNKISWENYHFSLLFKNQIFKFENPDFSVSTDIKSSDNFLSTDKLQIKINKFNLELQAKAKFNPKKELYFIDGYFNTDEITGKIKANLDKNLLNFEIYDANASSLEKFMNSFSDEELLAEIRSWIYGKIIAKSYKINKFGGIIDLNKKFNPNDLYGEAIAQDLKIKFHPNVKAVDVISSKIILKNDKLAFYLYKPNFLGKNLLGSRVVINNLLGKNPNIDIFIKTNSLFDDEVKKILQAYDIDFAIKQKSGKLQTDLKLNINFTSLDVSANGKFKLEDSVLLFGDEEFYSKNADLELKNDKLLIQNANLKNDIFDIFANGELDFQTYSGIFKGQIKTLDIANKELVDIKDKNISAKLDFKNDVILDIDDLNFKLIIAKNNQIFINSLKDLKQFSPLMQKLNVNDGNLQIDLNENNNIAKLKDVNFSLGLKDIKNNPYQKDDFIINFNDDSISGKSALNHIKFNYKDDLFIELNNIILEIKERILEENQIAINVNAKNSGIDLVDFNKTVLFDNFQAKLEDDFLDFKAKNKKAKISLQKGLNIFNIKAKGMSNDFVNNLTKLDAFYGGKFDLDLKGKSEEDFKVVIKAKDTFLADYTTYQQFLEFINSIPALISFKTPDFQNKGFMVKDGLVVMIRKKNIISLKAMKLQGGSADILGTGLIDLDKKSFNIDFELRVLKAASSLIDKIPLVNYIILGKDKSISTIIELRGTFDKPQFSTKLPSEIIKSPLNLIKNVLELPFNIFN